MRIVYAENPLKTRIELDDADRRAFCVRLKLDELEDAVSSARMVLDRGQWPWLAKLQGKVGPLTAEEAVDLARDRLDFSEPARYDGKSFDDYVLDRAVDLFQDLLGEHCGDCTCVPASCPKCYAEGLLGIDTIAGLGKHGGSKISSVFRSRVPGGPEPTLDEAIEALRVYYPVSTIPSWTGEDFDRHIPRWIDDARRARAWLMDYKATKLNSGGVR